jgi:hypothetical protein
MFVCLCVCMFGHNSGTPGAISTILGTHMAVRVCMCKNLMYIIYIFFLSPKHHFKQGGWCGRPAWDPAPQGLPIAAAVTFTQIGIEATVR